MNNKNILTEQNFLIEFIILKDNPANWNNLNTECLGKNGFVVQERIYATKEQLNEKIIKEFIGTDRARKCLPLIQVKNNVWPCQCSCVTVKPLNGNTQIFKVDGGIVVESNDSKLLFSNPISSPNSDCERSFYETFALINGILTLSGMKASDIFRTWLHIKDIIKNYDSINSARKHYFQNHLSEFGNLYPASTGVQSISLSENPLFIDFWAFSGFGLKKVISRSPKQCEPTFYQVLFSRVLFIEFPLNNLLLISGTASISETGETLYIADFRKQMERTLSVIESILNKNGGDFNNIVQAVIFIKRNQDWEVCIEVAQKTGFPCEKAIFQTSELCRDNLLCEVEAHAVIPHKGRN